MLELVVVGLGANLEMVYVHTDIACGGTAHDGRVAWMPLLPWPSCSGGCGS